MTFWIELIIVFICIFTGAKLKGVGLGLMGGLGLSILCFGFHVKPNNPPFNVLLIIICVVTAGMALEASGGLILLTNVAGKLIRKNPNFVTIIAPLVTFLFAFLTGTSHITYSLFPIISDVAIKAGVNPEKPLSASAIAALQAIIASPISAFTGVALAIFSAQGFSLLTLINIFFPSALIGTIASIIIVSKFKSTTFEKININSKTEKIIKSVDSDLLHLSKISLRSKISVIIFLIGIICVILSSSFRPKWFINGRITFADPTALVSIIMLSTAAIIVISCRVNTHTMIKGKIALAGFQAIIAILGIAWLGNTLFFANMNQITTMIKKIILDMPWTFCILLFFVNMITTSQAATLKMMVPIALAMGLSPKLVLGFLPAINSIFFIPSYPTMLAAIEFDPTGNTKIGKYIFNHSFMLPGLISTFVTLLSSILLTKFLL